MRSARDLYGHYRSLLFGLARSAPTNTNWPLALDAIIAALRGDLAELDAANARWLKDELCEQLEFGASDMTNPAAAREAFRAALKRIETIS